MPLYQHRFAGHLAAGDIFVFSWHSETSVSIDTSQSNAVAWAEALYAGPGGTNGWVAYSSSSVGIDRITTGEINVATGQQLALRENAVSIDGGVTGDALPAEVALVVSLRSALANRTGRGRFYLPQPAIPAMAENGNVLPAAQNALVAALANAWGDANAAGENPVIYSRTARATRQITSFDVGDLFDMQKRRQNSLTQQRVSAPMP